MCVNVFAQKIERIFGVSYKRLSGCQKVLQIWAVVSCSVTFLFCKADYDEVLGKGECVSERRSF